MLVGEEKMKFERLFEEQEKCGESNWAPFVSEEEWQLARWLSQHIGHKAIDEYLKLPHCMLLVYIIALPVRLTKQ